MGCGGSKVDDLPLVTLCRERKQLLKAAADHRYAFAASHVAYFYSLKDVGDAFRKFVEEELVTGGNESTPDSPVLTLPSDEGKSSSRRRKRKNSSSSTSISHSVDDKIKGEEIEEDSHSHSHSHLHLSSGSDLDSEPDSGHIHIDGESEEEEDEKVGQGEIKQEDEPSSYNNNFDYPYNYPYNYAQQNWNNPPNGNFNTYYMRKSSTPAKSVVYEEPERRFTEPGYGNGYPGYPNGGFFGFSMGSPGGSYENSQRMNPPGDKPQPQPPPPSPPRVSTWDYLNVFDTYDSGSSNYGTYPGWFKYGYGSSTSSPDSTVVREREGIPELEDETEPEVLKNEKHKNKINEEMDVNANMKGNNNHHNYSNKNKNVNFGEGTSRSVPMQNNSNVASPNTEKTDSQEAKSSGDTSLHSVASKSSEDDSVRRKGVSFEVEDSSITTIDEESSKPSSLTTLSVHGTRDLQEVVKEIRDEFETASSYGKEVALLLEVGKLPYQRRTTPLLKGTFSFIHS